MYGAETARGDLEDLSRHDCVELLASVPVGRIVYTEQALPAVQLVNFRIAGNTVVVRTGLGSKLAAAARHAVMAFEADRYDEASRTGWSVTVVGHAWVVEELDEIASLERRPLRPWAPGRRDHYVRIAIERVTGRRLAVEAAPAPAKDGETV